MIAMYVPPRDFGRLMAGLRGAFCVSLVEAVYVDGPVMERRWYDLVFDHPDCVDAFALRRCDRHGKSVGEDVRLHFWTLEETRKGRRIELRWEHSTEAVVYECEGAAA